LAANKGRPTTDPDLVDMDIDPTILVKFGEKSYLKVSENFEKIHAYILPWYSPMQIHMWPTQKKYGNLYFFE
jgi:hypothetical protein